MNIRLNENQKQFYRLYIELLGSVLNGTEPPALPPDFNWQSLCRRAQQNRVANIIGYAVDKVNVKPDEVTAKVIENERLYYILQETSQLVEVEKILRGFDELNVRNVPLKGYFMKQLYPQSDMRTMSDVDILVDKKNFKKVESVFNKLKIPEVDLIKSSEIHFKKDLMYFEIHSDLNENDDTSYNDIWSRVALREEYSCSYEMSKEDFYIYMIYHTAKHFLAGGIGIRMAMDVYVYLNSHKNLDFDYIEEDLRKKGIGEFEKQFRALAINWFSPQKTEINELGEFILYCSTFGDREICFYLDNKRTKRFYWLKQVFLPYKKMKSRYAYLNKAPFLLPFSWTQYWFSRLFVHRDIRFKEGFEARANKMDEENAGFITSLMDNLKLNN